MNKNNCIKYILSVTFLLLIVNVNMAQCVDPNKVNLQFPCPDPTFKPVCGCDGKTYRNQCSAEMQNGILPGQWRDGSCSGLEFDIIPTYTHDNLEFSFVQPQNVTTTAQLVIIDQNGAIMMSRTLYPDLSGIVKLTITETNNYKLGVYVMFLYNGKGDYRYKKFVKY